MKSSSASGFTTRRAWALAVLGAASAAQGAYEVPNAAYTPPTHYYDAAAGTGFTLRTNLHNIISANFTGRSYGDSRYAMGTGAITGSPSTGGGEDLDPNNPANILLAYNRGSVSAKWDGSNAIVWNREHVWPKYWLNVTSSQVSNTYTGPASDAFELRPADANINSGRGDLWYGYYPNTGGNGSPQPKSVDVSQVTNYGNNTFGGTSYWYPGSQDVGDVARTLFYMATRYFDPSDTSRTNLSINNLELVNGPPPVDTGSGVPRYKMGDLNSLLHWNYSDGVDNFERRRNQLIYGSSGDLTNHALNPSYYQGNRNPFIDHPEYVWAVFGGGNNNSQIYVGAAPDANGSGAAAVDLGRVIAGYAFPTGSVVVHKTGANPTTFDVTATGVTTPAASALQIGTGQPFDYNAVNKTMTVALSASTSTVGVKSGTVTINNTDLTTGGAGLGSADGNDTVNVTGTVVDHSNGSFTSALDQDAYTVRFEYVPQGFTGRTNSFSIANVQAPSGFTASLALNSVSTAGSSAFTTNATPFAQLAAGSANSYTVALDTSAAGDFTTTTTFNVSDEAIPGATANAPLVLTTTAHVIAHGDFAVNGTLDLRPGETFSTGPSSIAAGVTLNKNGPGTLNINGPQNNGVGSRLDISGGSVLFATDAGPNLGVVVEPGGHLQVQSPQHLASLTVTDGSPLVDLLTNPVTLASADPESLGHSLLAGTITSTSPDPNDTLSIGYVPSGGGAGYLLQLTFTGDANLDGTIDPDDYVLLDRGLARGLAGWVYGDFDYSGTVDAADYFLIDKSLGLQTGGALSPTFLADREARFGDAYVHDLIAAVPEPSVMGIAGAALLVVCRRNRPARARGG